VAYFLGHPVHRRWSWSTYNWIIWTTVDTADYLHISDSVCRHPLTSRPTNNNWLAYKYEKLRCLHWNRATLASIARTTQPLLVFLYVFYAALTIGAVLSVAPVRLSVRLGPISSPSKRRVVRWRNFARKRVPPTMCRTCAGFYVYRGRRYACR